MCCLDFKNAFLHADGFSRDVLLRAPEVWDTKNTHRVWKLGSPARSVNGAPVAIHRPLRKFLMKSEDSLALAALRFEASSFDPRFFTGFGDARGAVGAIRRLDSLAFRGHTY